MKHGDPTIVLPTGGATRFQLQSHVTYKGWHIRLARNRGKARSFNCVDCDSPAAQWSYNGGCADETVETQSNGKDYPYCMHEDHYSPRCKSCHIKKDYTGARTGMMLGEKNPTAFLTEDDVREIRRLRADGVRNKDIAAQFGIKPTHASHVGTGRLWSHIS
jgi:hypothetical protein